jgi:hypothetical protein
MTINNENKSLFEDLQTQETYKELLKQLPDDERPFVEKYVKELLEQFERVIDIL